jgi:hypothetical protein
MINITMTRKQYNRIRALKKFAQWYIDEHEGASGSKEAIEQWETDRDEVRDGIDAILELDEQLHEEMKTLNLWNT